MTTSKSTSSCSRSLSLPEGDLLAAALRYREFFMPSLIWIPRLSQILLELTPVEIKRVAG